MRGAKPPRGTTPTPSVAEATAPSRGSLLLTDPRTDITAEEAQAAMETILAANVVETSGGDLVEIIEARMRVTQVTVLK